MFQCCRMHASYLDDLSEEKETGDVDREIWKKKTEEITVKRDVWAERGGHNELKEKNDFDASISYFTFIFSHPSNLQWQC